MIRVRTLDLETSNWPKDGGKVCEAGYVDTLLDKDETDWWVPIKEIDCMKQQFFDPQAPMGLAARATHHITDEEVAGAPPHTELGAFIHAGDPDVYVAHNAEFEMNYVTVPEGKWWLDTYKVALRMFPDDTSHTNQYLRYRLGLGYDPLGHPPHRALPDAYTTAKNFLALLALRTASLKQMISWTLNLPYLTKVGFGEHFGKRYDEVPHGYLSWILRTDSMKPEVKAAARRALYGEN